MHKKKAGHGIMGDMPHPAFNPLPVKGGFLAAGSREL
jgi:hypothetical protein